MEDVCVDEGRRGIEYTSEGLAKDVFSCGDSLDEAFRAVVAAAPGNAALLANGRPVSYCELNALSNQVAWFLKRVGVRPEMPVAVSLDRSDDLITTILAIIRAGGAYVPIDRDYPSQRVESMLQEVGAPLLITDRASAQRRGSSRHANQYLVDDPEWKTGTSSQSTRDLPITTSGDSLAYVMYTSGSAGAPKAVGIAGRGIVRLAKSMPYGNVSANDTMLCMSTISFDAFTFEIWGALLNGARLALVQSAERSAREIAREIVAQGATVLLLPTGVFHTMADDIGAFENVRQVFVGGDALSAAVAQKFVDSVPKCRLINAYGPTESTTMASCCDVREQLGLGQVRSIGRPIPGTELYVLDDTLDQVKQGTSGELYITGDGLARGYIADPGLTASQFVPNPHGGDGTRIYKTGDRARWNDAGSLDFLGRVDQQIKVRGYRIEPAEVEAALKVIPGIADAVVTVVGSAPESKTLIAHVVPLSDNQQDEATLKRAMAERLPLHMVPGTIAFVESLPLLVNGKVDRAALAARAFAAPGVSGLTGPVEERLGSIWRNALSIEHVSRADNFFELGGHSLSAMKVIATVENEFHVVIPLTAIFRHPTIAELAKLVADGVAVKGGR